MKAPDDMRHRTMANRRKILERLIGPIKPKKKKKAGRSIYDPRYAIQAGHVSKIWGSTNNELAEYFKVSTQTIEHWKRTHPEFREATNDGKLHADVKVMERLYRRACGYEHPDEQIFYDSKEGMIVRAPTIKKYPPDTTAAIFWLKNRQPTLFRDKIDISDGDKLAGDIYNVLNVHVTPAEASKAYQQLMQIEAKAKRVTDV